MLHQQIDNIEMQQLLYSAYITAKQVTENIMLLIIDRKLAISTKATKCFSALTVNVTQIDASRFRRIAGH